MSAPDSSAAAAAAAAAPRAVVELAASDLVGHGATFCPNPRMTLWNAHPRVFLELGASGQAQCPYCGTVYRLKDDGAGGPRHGH